MPRKVLYKTIFLFSFFLIEIIFTVSVKKSHSNASVSVIEIPEFNKFTNSVNEQINYTDFEQDVNNFIEDLDIVGASIAIAKEGQLVYAKGFGYADSVNHIKLEPYHRFRIASVSKLITATAIMKLIEEGEISLNQQVFGKDAILKDEIYLHPVDQQIFDITIYDLLVHSAGWSKHKGDPVFMPLDIARKMNVNPPADLNTIIKYVWQNKLDFKPGKKSSYSNFGYVLLGKVIEEVTSLTYESYVNINIFDPLGIYGIQIGGSFSEEQFEEEVIYYEQEPFLVSAVDGSGRKVPQSYGGNDLRLIEAAGGWIASPVDLMKFLLAIDGNPVVPDILTETSVNIMKNASGEFKNLIGWKGSDGNGTLWRTGTLTGSSALVVQQKNNIIWLILTNTTTDEGLQIHSHASSMMFSAVNTIKDWPDLNLFYTLDKNFLAQKYNLSDNFRPVITHELSE